MGTMQGLGQLYDHTGRNWEWRQLVKDMVPDFVDPANGGPIAGREEHWSLVTGYRVALAVEARDWAEALCLQRARLEWNRQHASKALALPLEALDDVKRNSIRTVAVSLNELGGLERESGQPDCVESFKKSYDLANRIGDTSVAAVAALALGTAFLSLPSIRNLDDAELWSRRSLELCASGDLMGRAKCLLQLGDVVYERLELADRLDRALGFYLQALRLVPRDAIPDLAVTHNKIGVIYQRAGDLKRALEYYQKGIRYDESTGNLYGAAQSRYNVAVVLADTGRMADAKEYAVAALRNFEAYGAVAADDVQKTLELIAKIDSVAKAPSSGK